MRCPKCQYISFEEADRCRNCGYAFSLITTDAALDLPIRTDETLGPLPEVGLRSTPVRGAARAAVQAFGRETPRHVRRDVTPGALDLPLFNDERDDTPLVVPSAVPRPPLAVRRAAPVTPRWVETPATNDDVVLDLPALPERPARVEPRVHTGAAPLATAAAPASRRLLAAAVDLLIAAVIDVTVLHYTLRVLGLTLPDVRVLPVVPMSAFLLLLNGGYVAMFTAARGQTIGKMIAGIRIVPAAAVDERARVRFGAAVIRSAACVVSLLPAGLGFLMALFREDGRSLHDAIADTRVIRT